MPNNARKHLTMPSFCEFLKQKPIRGWKIMGRNGVEIGIKAKNIHNYKTKSELTNAGTQSLFFAFLPISGAETTQSKVK